MSRIASRSWAAVAALREIEDLFELGGAVAAMVDRLLGVSLTDVPDDATDALAVRIPLQVVAREVVQR